MEHVPTTKHRVSARSVLVAGLIAVMLGVGYVGYQRLTADIERLTLSLQRTNVQVARSSELLALLSEGNKLLQEQLAEEEDRREETVEQINSINERREELLSQIEVLESELSQQREQISSTDVSAVIAKWSKRIAQVQCTFRLSDGRRARSVGSAVATFQNGSFTFVTNKHVITGQSDLVPTECVIKMAEGEKEYKIAGTAATVSPDKDLGWLPIGSGAEAPAGVASALPTCTAEPLIGDELVILGYPSVGSVESLTATEGIISGFDKGMFITSAKIERGNSGGAAIHIKNNCFLGIPTLVVVGQIESLARILPL